MLTTMQSVLNCVERSLTISAASYTEGPSQTLDVLDNWRQVCGIAWQQPKRLCLARFGGEDACLVFTGGDPGLEILPVEGRPVWERVRDDDQEQTGDKDGADVAREQGVVQPCRRHISAAPP